MFDRIMCAARSGYVWSPTLQSFVRFLPRSDKRGYDVTINPTPHSNPRFFNQYPSVPLDTPAVEALVLASDLTRLKAPAEARTMVLDNEGRMLEGEDHERRVVGL